MDLPVVTRENYYDPEINMAYMGSTQMRGGDPGGAEG